MCEIQFYQQIKSHRPRHLDSWKLDDLYWNPNILYLLLKIFHQDIFLSDPDAQKSSMKKQNVVDFLLSLINEDELRTYALHHLMNFMQSAVPDSLVAEGLFAKYIDLFTKWVYLLSIFIMLKKFFFLIVFALQFRWDKSKHKSIL